MSCLKLVILLRLYKENTRFIYREVDIAAKFAVNKEYFNKKLGFNYSSDLDLDSDFTLDLFDNLESNSANKEFLKTFSLL